MGIFTNEKMSKIHAYSNQLALKKKMGKSYTLKGEKTIISQNVFVRYVACIEILVFSLSFVQKI